MKAVKNIYQKLFFVENNSAWLTNYRKIVYGIVLLDLLLQMPLWSELLRVDGLTTIQARPFSMFLYRPFLVLFQPPFASFYLFFVAAFIASLCLGFTYTKQRIWAVLIFYLFKSYCLKTSDVNNGGHDLMALLLFYNIFHSYSLEKPFHLIHISSIWLARLQVCSMYFFAFYYKTLGDYWFSGEALNLALQNPTYSLSWAMPFYSQIEPMLTLFNYFALFYPVLFLVFIWFDKTKKPLLILGVAFHMSIWAFMGLFDFAWFVMASYVLFQRKATFTHFSPFGINLH